MTKDEIKSSEPHFIHTEEGQRAVKQLVRTKSQAKVALNITSQLNCRDDAATILHAVQVALKPSLGPVNEEDMRLLLKAMVDGLTQEEADAQA